MELSAFRSPDGLPAAEQQPALPAAVLPHDRASTNEFLSAHFVEGGAGVLEHVELVEADLGLLQHGAHGVEIGAMHVGAHRRHRSALARRQLLGQQRRGAGFIAILAQPDHLAVDHIREHGPEVLALAALDLVESEMARSFLGRVRSQSARKAFSARRALPAPLDANLDATRRVTVLSVDSLHAEPGQSQDPLQSRRDPTRPPWLQAQQERTTPGGPVPSGIALHRPGRRADRPPQVRSAEAAGYYLRSLYSNR